MYTWRLERGRPKVSTSQKDNTSENPKCVQCEADGTGAYRLRKCSMCFKHVCERCAIRNYGRYFCSRQCTVGFFLYEE